MQGPITQVHLYPVVFFFWLAIFLFSANIYVYFCAVIIWYLIRYKTLKATVPPPCLHYCTNMLLCFPADLGISNLNELIVRCSVGWLASKLMSSSLFLLKLIFYFRLCVFVYRSTCIVCGVPGKGEEGIRRPGGGLTGYAAWVLRQLSLCCSSLQITFTQ